MKLRKGQDGETAREKKSIGKPRPLNSEGPQSIQVTGWKPHSMYSFYKNTLTWLFFKPVSRSLVGERWHSLSSGKRGSGSRARTHLGGFHCPPNPPPTPTATQGLYFHLWLHLLSTDDLEFWLGFPLIFRLFSWGKLLASSISISWPITTPFSLMIDAFWNIRRNGSLNCLVEQSRAVTSQTPKEGWRRMTAVTSLCPSADRSPSVPSFRATYPICFFLSTEQACLFSEGKRRDRWQLIEKQQFAFDKGALWKKICFEVWIFKK